MHTCDHATSFRANLARLAYCGRLNRFGRFLFRVCYLFSDKENRDAMTAWANA